MWQATSPLRMFQKIFCLTIEISPPSASGAFAGSATGTGVPQVVQNLALGCNGAWHDVQVGASLWLASCFIGVPQVVQNLAPSNNSELQLVHFIVWSI